MAKTQYFMFDEELWQEGIFENCLIKNGKLCFAEAADRLGCKFGLREAVYLSPVLDSKSVETIWHRLRLTAVKPGDSVFTVSLMAFDYTPEEESCRCLSELLRELKPLWTEKQANSSDMLLFTLKGRYLRFKIELTAYDGSQLSIGALRIDFPIDSIAGYLPEIYRREATNAVFLQKYLGVYQSILDDLQEKIEGFAVNLDADAAEKDCLFWLAVWANVPWPELWPEEKLRQLIKISFRLYAAKGTASALKEILFLYCGKEPFLIETAQLMRGCPRYMYDRIYRPLFGTNIYDFYILLEEAYVKDAKKMRELNQIAAEYKPAHTEMHLVVLMPYIVLGGHTYLGINSSLPDNQVLSLKDNITLPFDTVVGGEIYD